MIYNKLFTFTAHKYAQVYPFCWGWRQYNRFAHKIERCTCSAPTSLNSRTSSIFYFEHIHPRKKTCSYLNVCKMFCQQLGIIEGVLQKRFGFMIPIVDVAETADPHTTFFTFRRQRIAFLDILVSIVFDRVYSSSVPRPIYKHSFRFRFDCIAIIRAMINVER